MPRVRLIHWNVAEVEERAAQLRAIGCETNYEPLDAVGLRHLREDAPDAIVIDLSRRPSQGRDVAIGLRMHKATRYVPLIFVDGEPEKVAHIQELLPDALYITWQQIEGALREAIGHPPVDPVLPPSAMAGYSGTPLPKKLGIRPGSAVALINAPEGFENTLGTLPPGARVDREMGGPRDLTLWFVRSREELAGQIGAMLPFAVAGGLWIIWPKRSSGVATDLSETVVRQVGLGAGLVDFKVCAVDATWSGLRFSRRQTG